MRNIWTIFKTDIRTLSRCFFACVVVLAIALLPSLYAWLNIYSNWDPYGSTGGISIAVASLDRGYTDGGEYVNKGRDVLEDLKTATSINWVIVNTEKEATDSVCAGDYYAAVVIDEDFSRKMYRMFTDWNGRPAITYYENAKKNAVATKITDTAVETLKRSISENYLEVLIGGVMEQSNLLAADLTETDPETAVKGLLYQAQDVLTGCRGMMDAIRGLTGSLPVTDSDLRRQLDTVVSDVSDTLAGVRALSADARALQAALSDTTAALNTTVDLLRPAAERMVSALSDTIDKLEGLSADEYMDMLLEILGGDPIAYSQYFPQMVQTTVHKVYPIENYGSAMAPFYTTLAIWVGCVILSTLIKVHARTDGLIDPTPAELYFGRYLFFFLLSQIQAAVIVTGDLYLLGIQCEHPGLLYLTASLTAFTFSLLIYSLALSFGDVGKALVVVVMVMQIAGSSGTFPIELLPEIYQKIYRFFPFPYAIDAMRECICGLYGDYYIRQLAFLLLFVAAALLIGLLVRRPFMGLNRFMEEKLEETELL